MENFIQPEQFPYKTPTGWSYDSGNYPAALQKAMDTIDYAGLRKEQAEKRAARRADGHRHQQLHRDRRRRAVARLRHPRAQDVRLVRDPGPPDRQGPRPDRRPDARARATRRPSPRSSPRSSASRSQDIKIEYGDTDTAPYGLGTYASRSTPVAGAADARWPPARSRPRRASSRRTCSRRTRTTSSGSPASSASRARRTGSRRSRRSPSRPTPTIPQGMEAGLEAVDYYDPPNLTFPFGSYICVVDIDKGTGRVNVRRFVAIDDCGNIINPMIVDGQIHGGLTWASPRRCTRRSPTTSSATTWPARSWTTSSRPRSRRPAWETGKTVDPVAASPDRRQGRRGVGHGRRPAGDRQRRGRCPVAPRRPQHRHPDHAPEGVGDPPREGHLA